MMNSNLLRNLFLVSFLFLSALPTWAIYLSVGESGEILSEEKRFQIGFGPQLILNNDSGANISAFLDSAWSDSLSSRFVLGAGIVDFYSSASLKYIPFPDVDRQPAIGVKTSFWHARIDSENISTLHLAPMVSKKVQSYEYGQFTPYGALGLSFYELEGKSKTGTQFFIGSDWKSPQYPDFNFTGEWAFSLQDSTSSLSILIALPFDDKKGF